MKKEDKLFILASILAVSVYWVLQIILHATVFIMFTSTILGLFIAFVSYKWLIKKGYLTEYTES